jgi:hypothetical protein
MLILLLRGHVRETFENDELYDLIKEISNIVEIEIYISTWNIYANNLSWREIKEDNREITEQIIRTYFRELQEKIHLVLIHDEKNILLNGRIDGVFGKGDMPIRAWKNMWYSQYFMMDFINKTKPKNQLLLNLRLDILKNSNRDINNKEYILHYVNVYAGFLKNNANIKKNNFLLELEWAGIDNIIGGTVETMYKLLRHFHFNLDAILTSYGNFKFPHEVLVYRENDKIF